MTIFFKAAAQSPIRYGSPRNKGTPKAQNTDSNRTHDSLQANESQSEVGHVANEIGSGMETITIGSVEHPQIYG